MHIVAACHEVKQGKGLRDFIRLQISPQEVQPRLKLIRGRDTDRQRQSESETTGEITLITHTVHLTASWNHTLLLHWPPCLI